jgi:hypothetical protein
LHAFFQAMGRLLKAHLHTDIELLADAIAIENFLFSQNDYASNGSNIY